MEISNRLKFVAQHIDKCDVLVDIGTDHGYIPIYAVKNNLCERAIATDINKGPVKKAKQNVGIEGESDRIEVRLGGGLNPIEKGQADCIIIAGMGGNLIRDILEADKEKLKGIKTIILQPAQNPEVLRKYLYNNNYQIMQEDLCFDEGIFYELFKVKYGVGEDRTYKPIDYEISKKLISENHPLINDFLKFKENKYLKIIEHINDSSESAKERKEDINSKLSLIQKILKEGESVKISDIIDKIEIFAPIKLKEDYDNVGLMVGDKNKTVKKVLFALDCTKEVIEEAKKLNAELIITHHPLLFRKPKNIISDDLQGSKIIALIKNNISLYSCHTNLDSAKGGINDALVRLLGFNSYEIIEKSKINGFEQAGIGRIIDLNEKMKFDDFINLIKTKLNINSLRVVRSNEYINKIAVINGSGQDYFDYAFNIGADCILTGDTTYHYASDFKEKGVSIIDAGHFYTEWLPFLSVIEKITDSFDEVEFIRSNSNKDPYEII